VLGLKRGWAGLLHFDPDDPASRELHTVELTRQGTRTIDRTGGTFLHTSRTNPGRVGPKEMPEFLRASLGTPSADRPLDCTPHILRVIEHLGLGALIVIGGDDTLSYAVRLHREGVPVVCIPKTMDNDVHGTDYCIGFSTAVSRSVDFIHALRTAAGSHERIAVIELFGRYSGETSLISAYLAGADRAVISEGAKPVGGSMVMSGEADAYGHQKLGGIGLTVAHEIERRGHVGVLYQQLGYLMRSGDPDALDRMVATSYGYLATDLLLKRQSGRMVALREGKYTSVSADVIAAGQKRVDVAELYDIEQYRPKVAHLLGKPMFLY
jgi:6-phosphofructokinase 1